MKNPDSALGRVYRTAHNHMRNVDGLHPAEALDELLKYLLFKISDETSAKPIGAVMLGLDQDEVSLKAEEIRARFTSYVVQEATKNSRGREPDQGLRDFVAEGIHLSDSCLVRVHQEFSDICLKDYPADIRSAALRSFLSPELRKGLGIFLTPDNVVEEISAIFDYHENASILDPACGSGTFLLAVLRSAIQGGLGVRVSGIDKNPRMTLMADINIGHLKSDVFSSMTADTLRSSDIENKFPFESYDYVLTNPPFGVKVDATQYDLSCFTVVDKSNSKTLRRYPSETLFIEQSLRLLKPGGYLAIVLPRSVVNTKAGAIACANLASVATVRAVITLPPETFSSTGTMTNTIVLIIQKYGQNLTSADTIRPVVARISNVGFDNTGRSIKGSQLPGLGLAIRRAISEEGEDNRLLRFKPTAANKVFGKLGDILRAQYTKSTRSSARLGDLIELARTGATPARKAYADSGIFLVKVGNLSGSGLNWIPRDRNFIDLDAAPKRYFRDEMMLRTHDVLLTSSAHSPKYIGKKVDIVGEMPPWAAEHASYVGEVMMLRADPGKFDPFMLTAFLRLPQIMEQLQHMVRGQTAHLHVDDVLGLKIDSRKMMRNDRFLKLAELIRQEANFAYSKVLNSKEQAQLGLGLLEEV